MNGLEGSLDDLGKWQISHLKGSLVGTKFILLKKNLMDVLEDNAIRMAHRMIWN